MSDIHIYKKLTRQLHKQLFPQNIPAQLKKQNFIISDLHYSNQKNTKQKQ